MGPLRFRACVPAAACLGLLLLPAGGPADEPAPLSVRTVAFSPDGKRLAAGTGEPNQSGTLTMWDLGTGQPLWVHREETGIPGVAFAPDGGTVALAVYGRVARVLDPATGKQKATLPHPKEVRAIAFSPDGNLLATACWDRSLRVWDLCTGAEKLSWTAHTGRIFSVQFSPDGKRLVSAGGEDGAKLWDARTGKELRVWAHGRFFVSCARFTPDGRWVLTGGYDGTIRVWDAETGAQRVRFTDWRGADGLAYSPAALSLAACSGKQVAVFELLLGEPAPQEQERIRTLLARLDDASHEARETAGKELLRVGFVAEPALRRAATESPSAEVRLRARRLRDSLLSQPRLRLRGPTDLVGCLDFSPDGKLLAAGGKDGAVHVWDLSSGKEVARYTPRN
jgi:WD40 repeat protein